MSCEKNQDFLEGEEDILRKMSEAEMVLVGLGEAFDAAEPGDAEKEAMALLREKGMAWLLPLCEERLRGEEEQMRIGRGLENLAKALEGKNYFVISQGKNNRIPSTAWRQGRLVMPCGTMLKAQCSAKCEGSAPSVLSDEIFKKLEALTDRFLENVKEPWEEAKDQSAAMLPPKVWECMQVIRFREKAKKPVEEYVRNVKEVLGSCECCGAERVLNVLAFEAYDQRGYLTDWDRYTKWLSGSMNRKLLLLELGTSESLPGLIREPFQKISELNLKSGHYRIGATGGSKMEQKAVETCTNAIDWLEKLC